MRFRSRLLAAAAALTAATSWLVLSVTADDQRAIEGTDRDELIVVGPQSAWVAGGGGNDFIIGGAGDNRYLIAADPGQTTIHDVAGNNVVEFDATISYSDVASGLTKSGDDLVLRIGHQGQALTIKHFFSVSGTISDFRFSSGEYISASLLFQLFGVSPPSATQTAKIPRVGAADAPLLAGTPGGDVLIPVEETESVRGFQGDDILVGRGTGVTFEIGRGNGRDLVVAYEGENVILFVDGITFGEVASNLIKAGDDLILRIGAGPDEVRIYRFFSHGNTVASIRFESGLEITAGELFDLFGVPEPVDAPRFRVLVDGVPIDDRGNGSGDGEDGSQECTDPDGFPTDCEGDGGDPPGPGEPCDDPDAECDGGGEHGGGGDGDGEGSDEPGFPEGLHRLIGSDRDEVIFVGEGDNLVLPGAGDDFVLGGPGNNHYFLDAGDGRNTIVEVAGHNIVQFGSGIGYGDVSGSFMRTHGSDDLVLRMDQRDLRLIIRDFFALTDTIAEFRLDSGQRLTREQIFGIFGSPAPSGVRENPELVVGRGDTDTLVGTPGSDLVVPRMGARTLRGGPGVDYLLGSRSDYEEAIVFQVRPGDGVATIITAGAGSTLMFAGGITFQGIASQLWKAGDDLVLRSDLYDVEVTVHQFFTRARTVTRFLFDDGEELSASEVFDRFGLAPPALSASFDVLLKGAELDSCYVAPASVRERGFGLTEAQLAVPNEAPDIISAPGDDAWYARPYEYQVRATDPDNDDLCFSLVSAPVGAEIVPHTGLIRWTPARGQIGPQAFEIQVTDARGGSTRGMVELEVRDPNEPPVITSTPMLDVVVGQSYRYAITATDHYVADDTLTYRLVSGPDGMHLEGRALHWTPGNDQLASHPVVVEVIDRYGLADTQRFNVRVLPLITLDELPEGFSRVPRTGARYSAHPLDDAALRIGTPRAFQRDPERETVIDRVNGLIWQDNSDVLANQTRYPWAGTYCENLELGGIDTWRLPNRLELVYLMEHFREADRAHLISDVFEHVGHRFDNSEFFARNVTSRPRIQEDWNTMVRFFQGEVLPADSAREANIRCVSGEQRFLPELLKPEESPDLVVDRNNRLMWQDNPAVLALNGPLEEALDYCDALELAGHDDWRLPNFNESQLLMREFEYFVKEDHRWPSRYFVHVPDPRFWHSSILHTGNHRAQRPSGALDNFRFRYQYDPEANYAGSWYANLNFQPMPVTSEWPYRCIRSYAEPTAAIQGALPETAVVGEPVRLDGSASHHVDGEILRYRWEDLTSERVLGEDAVVDVEFHTPGVHEIQLTVWDQHGLAQGLPQPIEILVYGPPELVVEGERVVWAGKDVELDASGSSDASGIAGFQWRMVETGDIVSQGPLLRLDALAAGEWLIELTVTNGQGLTASEVIAIRAVERPDVVVEGSREVLVGDDIVLDAGRSSGSNLIVRIQWLDADTGDVIGEQSGLTLQGLPAGSHAVILSLTDSMGLNHQERIEFTVDHHAPVIVLPAHRVVAESAPVSLDASETHVPYGEVQAFRWFEDGSPEVIGSAAELELPGLPVGTWRYRLEVESTAGKISSQEIVVRVGHRPVADLPERHFAYAYTAILMDGSGSHVADEAELTFTWTLDDNWLGDTPVAQIDELEPGDYQVRLEVSTALGIADAATMVLTVEPPRELVGCPVVRVEDDRHYRPSYPERNLEWRGNQAETVEEIARAFNHARSQDPSVSQYLIMPDQATWDAMSLQAKGLYLVNAERQARGIKPYTGFDPALVTAAGEYAAYIRSNNLVIDHYADGRSPMQRMDAQPYIQEHRDSSVPKAESLASGSSGTLPTEEYALIHGIFGWLYQDKDWYEDFDWADGPAWGHRDHVLQTGLEENHGETHEEGLVGFGVSLGHYAPGLDRESAYGHVTVFKTLDQGPDWDPARLTQVDVRGAQGCNTAHLLEIDRQQIPTDGLIQLEVHPSTLHMVPGQSRPIRVTGRYDDGSVLDFTRHARFVADHQSVVSVAEGSVTAERSGIARVLARVNGIESNRLHVRVGPAMDTGNLRGTSAEPLLRYLPDNASGEAFDPKAVAVYAGRVVDRQRDPLEGVQISFLNRPGLGSVETDRQGRFMVTAPAGRQTLVYEKRGHVVVQRTTIGASNGWAVVDDVMLLARDGRQTFIDLTSGEPQVHQSSVIRDGSGERRATVVFNDITAGTVRSADGSQRPLDAFWFSATDFETPESMPGELPAETAFTWASDLHVAGLHYSDTIEFDGNVVMFVDNFLGFQVGEIVPIGYFDRLANEWVASPNGVVVRLIDESGDGVVDGIDYTGDGMANDLNGSGVTWDDAIGLTGYQPGDTLWWGSFNHFTPFDYNWSAADAEAPTSLDAQLDREDPDNDELACTGSYAKPYRQTSHEDILIAGTGLVLHYASGRAEGYRHRLRVRVSGEEISPSLERMIARLEVAGHVFQRELDPAPNQEVEFVWDGKDAGGTRPPGIIHGRVSIGYEYPTVYLSSGNAAEEEQAPGDFPVAWATVGNNATAVPGREAFISWQTQGVSFKNSYDRQIANGWSLSVVHEYDPAGRVYLGSGGVENVATGSLVLRTGLTYSLVDGDDGYYQSGGSTIDYSINDENILVDRVTGLEWQYSDTPHEVRTREAASRYCAQTAEPRGTGWRLPSAKELGYTIEKSGANLGPMIYNLTRARDIWHQWAVNPDDRLRPVVCVRGEPLDQRYVRNLKRDTVQQVVIDQGNGLMWQDAPVNASLKLDWESSIAHCEASNHADYDDWRLPNINELLYVLPNDVFAHQTELVFPPGQHWDHTASFRRPYWSSTSNFRDDDLAWAIESASYHRDLFLKGDAYHVRCVRDASSASRMPYRFDSDGKHIATIDLDSGVTLLEFDYNDRDQLVGIVDRFQNRVQIHRDAGGIPTRILAPDGQVTRLEIDDRNNLERVAYEDDTGYRFSYRNGGLLREKADPRGNTFTRSYDIHGRVLETGDPEGGLWAFFDQRVGVGRNRYGYTTIEGNHYQTERQVLSGGDVRRRITRKDGTEVVRLQQADRLRETRESCGVTTEVENVLDARTRQEIPNVITVRQPDGLTSVTTLTKTYAENGADTTRYTVTSDRFGDVSMVSVDARAGEIIHRSPEGRQRVEHLAPDTLLLNSVVTDGLLETTFDYDERGRLHRQTTGERVTSYTYDDHGHVATTTAPDQRETHYRYDPLGRVIQIRYPDSHSTLIDYDENGNHTAIVVPTEAEHGFDYNSVNRVTEERAPLSEPTRYEYDRDRRLTAIQLPSGQRIEHMYVGGQRVRTDTPEGPIDYTYLCGSRTESVREGSESLHYGWNGTLLTGKTYQGLLNETIAFDYDNRFRLSGLSYAGAGTSLAYDGDDLLTGIHGYVLQRDPGHGLPVEAADGAVTEAWRHNGYGELEEARYQLHLQDVFAYVLDYNALGQIVGKRETLPDGSEHVYVYEYDARRRLAAVYRNGQLVERYHYDANGNRERYSSTERGRHDVTASYTAGDQLVESGGSTYAYDDNGRLRSRTTAGETTRYHYSSLGRLERVELPGRTVEYRHNALGNRVAKLIDGDVVEMYLWQDKTTLLATYDGEGNLRQRFEYVLGHVPSRFTQDGATYYLLSDHLGSPRIITDAQGAVVRAMDYDAYGNIIRDSNPDFTIPFGFAGGLHDPDTGLIRFGYRDYDPDTGRWTARDPIGFAGGDTNLYGYVLNDPVNWIDLDGQQMAHPSDGYWVRPPAAGQPDPVMSKYGSVETEFDIGFDLAGCVSRCLARGGAEQLASEGVKQGSNTFVGSCVNRGRQLAFNAIRLGSRVSTAATVVGGASCLNRCAKF
ncbi:MAG: DUF1566 domain-containing protein [Ectothiorhodospiraceae bacterium]|nr:DUF1566 domain-containing protein [Ectothiorhodospiraceae bacterium]